MNPKIILCIVARTVSTRLPHKVLRIVKNKHSLIDTLIQRLQLVRNANSIYLCTSTEACDDILADVADLHSIKTYRGSADEVIERLLSVGKKENATHIVRITGDNVFTDPFILMKQIDFHLKADLEYSRTEFLPIGVTAEIINMTTLEQINRSIDPKHSEYLMLYSFNPAAYRCGVMIPREVDYSFFSLTVDTIEDLKRTRAIAHHLPEDSFLTCGLAEIINIIKQNKIENAGINPASQIKLPESKTISYEIFREEIKKKIQAARQCFFDLEG